MASSEKKRNPIKRLNAKGALTVGSGLRKTTPVTTDKLDQILRNLEKGHTIVYSCELAGVARKMFYVHRHDNPAYNERVEEAYRAGIEMLEEEARRRGHDGHDALVVHQGRPCYHTRPVEQHAYSDDGQPLFNEDGEPIMSVTHELILDANGKPIPLTEKKYSDNLLMFTMKARDPQKYSDKRDVTNHGDPSAVPVNLPELRTSIADRMAGLGAKITVQETITRTVTVDSRPAPAVKKPNGSNGHGSNGGGNGHG